MSIEAERRNLVVVEYGGTARSGKGTIVDYLVGTHPDVTKAETGLYYRVLTKQFLAAGIINRGMDSGQVQAALSDKGVGELVEMLASSIDWTTPAKKSELYQDDVNQLAPDVGQVHNARQAVKGGFAGHIKRLVDEGNYRAVAIDGRNLAEVVKKIDGARMLLRTFVECSPFEAALRECARDNIAPGSPAGQQILKNIQIRNDKDRSRQEDPMLIDDNAIDYWQGTGVEAAARQLASARSSVEYHQIVGSLDANFSESSLPTGVGRIAASNSRQIKFDTTVFRLFDNPKEAMLRAAGQMFDEALSQSP